MYDTSTGTIENAFADMKLIEFETEQQAEEWKEKFLADGNYPDHPHSVLEITI